jgi:hypothetical protein
MLANTSLVSHDCIGLHTNKLRPGLTLIPPCRKMSRKYVDQLLVLLLHGILITSYDKFVSVLN